MAKQFAAYSVEGDVVDVPTKNPFTSTAMYGWLLLVVRFALDRAAAKGWLPDALKDATQSAAAELLTWLIGLALVAYGRWVAQHPLSFTKATKTVDYTGG